jgi:hypothetical protein
LLCQLSRYNDWLRAGRSGDLIPVGARFFAHFQIGPGAHPASCTVGTESFPGVKQPGRCADHPSPSSAPSGPSSLLQGTFTLTFYLCYVSVRHGTYEPSQKEIICRLKIQVIYEIQCNHMSLLSLGSWTSIFLISATILCFKKQTNKAFDPSCVTLSIETSDWRMPSYELSTALQSVCSSLTHSNVAQPPLTWSKTSHQDRNTATSFERNSSIQNIILFLDILCESKRWQEMRMRRAAIIAPVWKEIIIII